MTEYYSSNRHFVNKNIFFVPAPSAPPSGINVSAINSSTIIVQWGPVVCIHRNGDITGYSVRYGVHGSGNTQTMSVSGGATTETTITGLDAGTLYSIEVAAVNKVDTGDYSRPYIVATQGAVFQ